MRTGTLTRWQPLDVSVFPVDAAGARGRCMHPGCESRALVMRGAVMPNGGQEARRWTAYCRTHGAMCGVLVRRGSVVTRLGR